MIVLSNEEVDALFPMEKAIDVVADAMIAVSAGVYNIPRRFIVDLGKPNNMGVMPGAMLTADAGKDRYFGTKLISLFPDNPNHGYSSHRGAVVLFEAEFGNPVAMMNADLLTARRTAAASAVATRALARDDTPVLAIVGTGEQAEYHIDAMVFARPIDRILVVGRTIEKARNLALHKSRIYPDVEFVPGTDIQAAVGEADIVCTVTASRDAIVETDWVRPGTHLNIVGSSIPGMREVHPSLIARSALFVDYRDSTLTAAGEVIEAIETGLIGADHIRSEIGEVLAGRERGRTNGEEITLYRSLGIVAQDIASAAYIYERAQEKGAGTTVSL